MSRTPYMARVYLLLAVLLIGTPTYLSIYNVHSGKLLIATGQKLSSPTAWPFGQSVIYLKEHNLGRAYGVIINHPLTKLPSNIPPFYHQLGLPFYYGGPVAFPEQAFVLRTVEGKLSLTGLAQEIKDNKDFIVKLKQNRDTQNPKIMLGYAGWFSFQLNVEILRDHWGVIDTDISIVNGTPDDQIWNEALKKLLQSKPIRKVGI